MKDPLENISHDFKKDMKEMDINERVAKALGWVPNSDGTLYVNGEYVSIPNYSGSIEAAWEIVEKYPKYQGGQFYLIKYSTDWEGGWFNFTSQLAYGSVIRERAKTAPLAICLAFLKLIDSRSETVMSEASQGSEGEKK